MVQEDERELSEEEEPPALRISVYSHCTNSGGTMRLPVLREDRKVALEFLDAFSNARRISS